MNTVGFVGEKAMKQFNTKNETLHSVKKAATKFDQQSDHIPEEDKYRRLGMIEI